MKKVILLIVLTLLPSMMIIAEDEKLSAEKELRKITTVEKTKVETLSLVKSGIKTIVIGTVIKKP